MNITPPEDPVGIWCATYETGTLLEGIEFFYPTMEIFAWFEIQ